MAQGWPRTAMAACIAAGWAAMWACAACAGGGVALRPDTGEGERAGAKVTMVNGVEFEAVVPAEVRTPADTQGAYTAVPISLRITNHRRDDVQFYLLDTVRVQLRDASGRAYRTDGGRDRTRPGPVVSPPAPPGETLEAHRAARLEWRRGTQTLRLWGDDGFGGLWYIDGLVPGDYFLSIQYAHGGGRADASARVWTGEVTTAPVRLTIR